MTTLFMRQWLTVSQVFCGEEQEYGFTRLALKQLLSERGSNVVSCSCGKSLPCLTLLGTGRNIQFGYPNDWWIGTELDGKASCPFCPLPNRVSPRRRRPHGPFQLALCPAF